MDSLTKKYLYFLPIYFSFGSLLKNMWYISIITTVALFVMCFYSITYRYLNSKIKNFYYYLWGSWFVVFLISLAKYYDRFDNAPVYFVFFIVIVFLIYFLHKMGKVIDTISNEK